jgi:bifunctional non-homologous end joining protein LigD
MLDRLQKYRAKRDFEKTAEPSGARKQAHKGRSYLIQKHAATRLHYDFRLEHNGVLLSWACPKGPSLNPEDKRLAVHVEDHPLEYGGFEGTIPKGEYGGGTVMLWDRGTWEPHGDVDEALKKGKLAFTLHGERLKGNWALIRLRGRPGDRGKDNWLLIKEKDDEVRKNGTVLVDRELTSISTGREMEEIAQGADIWRSNRAEKWSSGKKAKIKDKKSGTASGSKKKSEARAAETGTAKTGAGKIPPFVPPQLATLIDSPPSGGEWLHEIKYDGYRAVTSIGGGSVIVRTRNGLDWTDKFRSLAGSLAQLPCDSALLDGEIAVADAEGHTSFSALQVALSEGRGTFGYYLFDLLHLDGKDLRARPLVERKRILGKLLSGVPKGGPLFYSSHMAGQGEQVFHHACDLKLEGIISKRATDPYRSGRTKSWLKTKCGMEQEFVIIGWQPSDKAARPFRSILLALREEGELRYVGRVGTGYTEARLDALAALFKKHARGDPPVPNVPRAFARHAKWIEPVLVAEVAFRGWTHDGMIRQGSFKGLREDKPARAIIRERPMPKAQAVKMANEDKDEIAGVHITHPDRIVFADQGVTKRELIEYYVAIADHMLPYIEGRPLALVRCPQGREKECFFQKHASPGWPDLFGKIRIKEKTRFDEYMYIEDLRGLVGAAQMGVLELHLWGSRVDDVEKPDRMVFDLDPDEGLDFGAVKQAAKDVKKRLEKIGLQSFPMVTGGKGVHVVVPLARKHGWDEHRAFAEALARVMADEEPGRFVANMAKKKRTGKIFIDYLRNQRGSTAIAPFSTRARKGAFVAMPVSWPGLARLENAHPASIKNAVKLFARGKDPWAGYLKVRQSLPLPKRK